MGGGGAEIRLYAGGSLLATVPIPDTDDGSLAEVAVGVSGVDFMIVDLQGSGAIDNIGISWEEDEEGEGCTLGFWKQEHHFDSWTGHTHSDSCDTEFSFTATFETDPTLLDALNAKGGGEAALARHAVAAFLNAASPDVDYLYTEAEVIALVQDAYSSGGFESAIDILEVQNELVCELD